MQITNVKCPTSKYKIKCPYEMTPEYITVHNTYNDASAMAEISYMLGNNLKTSFHVAIDDYRIVTGIPFNRNAWIEICYSKSGGKRFEEAEELAAEYIAYLLKKYGWGIDRVKKHQDWSGKYCPHRTLDLGWKRFLNKIEKYLGIQKEEHKPSNTKKGSDEKVRTYQNGSTSEIVYADTDCTIKIGSLNPREKCDCFGIFEKRAMVRYKVSGHSNYKIGFCKWTGGVK